MERVSSMNGEQGGVYRVLVWKSETKAPLRRPWRLGKQNFTTCLKEIRSDVVDWNDLAQNRIIRRAVVNKLLNLKGPKYAKKLS